MSNHSSKYSFPILLLTSEHKPIAISSLSLGLADVTLVSWANRSDR